MATKVGMSNQPMTVPKVAPPITQRKRGNSSAAEAAPFTTESLTEPKIGAYTWVVKRVIKKKTL